MHDRNKHSETTPYTIDLSTDAGYLDLLSRKIFHGGFSVPVVDRKWADFRRVFHDFDPARVVVMSPVALEAAATNRLLIRNPRKLMSIPRNAAHMLEVAGTHGTWTAWLHSLRALTYEERADTLGACLSMVGPTTLFWFLLEAGEATLDDRPEHVREGKGRGRVVSPPG